MISRIHDTDVSDHARLGNDQVQGTFPQLTKGAACGNRPDDLLITRAAHTDPSPRYLRLRAAARRSCQPVVVRAWAGREGVDLVAGAGASIGARAPHALPAELTVPDQVAT
jgi:hypothetical protein